MFQKQSVLTVPQLIRKIRVLPSDPPRIDPRVWYRTQKEHWLGWLGHYHTQGAYGRDTSKPRDARFAYNHVVNYLMLLWIIDAAGLPRTTVATARRAAAGARGLAGKSAAIRRVVTWDDLARVLWPKLSRLTGVK
jgi:hypothetical protein